MPTVERANAALSRRSFLRLGAATAAGAATLAVGDAVPGLVDAFAAPKAARKHAYLTTDFAVPPIDADDYYDVACAIALGFEGIVLDEPSPASILAVRQLGGTVVKPRELRRARSIVVVGAVTHAARHGRDAERIVLFAGDAQGEPEHNVALDPAAYEALAPRSFLVPCGDGGIWRGSERTSFLTTDDHVLLEGAPCRWWFERYVSIGPRNLWGGPLLRFAYRDTWRGQTVSGGSFRGSGDFAETMITGTRELLATLPKRPVTRA
jgi:hypothetical protein